MKAEILSVGSELVAGRIADTNAAFLSKRLMNLGIPVTRHTAVDDCQGDIVDALRCISERADLAIVSGGIGPTPDDVTRQAFAEFCGVGMTEIPEAVAHINRLFALRGRQAPASNMIQARIPENSVPLPNSQGTATGFQLTANGCEFFCLPGVPREMKAMFDNTIAPQLKDRSGSALDVVCLQTFGMPESTIGEKLNDLMGKGRNPEVATQACEGVITIRVTARSTHSGDAQNQANETAQRIRDRLGKAVFAEGQMTMAETVAGLLESASLTLAVAESCTGGEIASRLTNVPGISRFLMECAVTYSNASKTRRLGVPDELIRQHGAVSEVVAKHMAQGMRTTSGADIALATTGIAGPGGGTDIKPVGLVYVALTDARDTYVEELRLRGNRTQVKDRAAKSALNTLRRYLEERRS